MEEDLIQIPEMLVAVAVAIIAYWQRCQKIEAKNKTRLPERQSLLLQKTGL